MINRNDDIVGQTITNVIRVENVYQLHLSNGMEIHLVKDVSVKDAGIERHINGYATFKNGERVRTPIVQEGKELEY